MLYICIVQDAFLDDTRQGVSFIKVKVASCWNFKGMKMYKYYPRYRLDKFSCEDIF